MSIVDYLSKLPPTHNNGINFEELVCALLKQSTGFTFRIAKTGSQDGRDASSRSFNRNVITIECKRYLDSTNLDARELLGEMVEATSSILDLDIWVLVTTKVVDSQLSEKLQSFAVDRGIEFLTISQAQIIALCAENPDIVINFLNKKNLKSNKNILDSSELQDLQVNLSNIRQNQNPGEEIKTIKDQFLSPLIGYASWRDKQNSQFLECLRSEKESRAYFGESIAIRDQEVRFIERKSLKQYLDDWYANWGSNRTIGVILGEEGDGKTWGTASWLAEKVETEPDFPPIVFLGSSKIGNPEPKEFISEAVHRLLPHTSKDRWSQRVVKWSRGLSNFPSIILVLNGINERHGISFWKTVFNNLGGSIWQNIGILVTCRKQYWDSNTDSLRGYPVSSYLLDSYNDEELIKALKFHNLKLSELSRNLFPLICKPRYLELVIKHREKIKSGITIPILIYEDWRDRLNRKQDLALTDDEFQGMIKKLAKQQNERKKIERPDICNLLPIEKNSEILQELSTGGILRQKQGNYTLNEKFSVYGLALLLLEDLERGTSEGEDFNELLASWLEPQSSMDIKAEICHFALMISLESEEIALNVKTSLLHAWISCQNPGSNILDVISYLPLSPKSFVDLAETVWTEASNNPWAQELIMQAFLRGIQDANILESLNPSIDRWLGLICIDGYRDDDYQARNISIRDRIEQLVGKNHESSSFVYYDYQFDIIEDSNLLRLGRFALAIISECH